MMCELYKMQDPKSLSKIYVLTTMHANFWKAATYIAFGSQGKLKKDTPLEPREVAGGGVVLGAMPLGLEYPMHSRWEKAGLVSAE